MTRDSFTVTSPCPGCGRQASREHPEVTTLEDIAARLWHVRCARVALAGVERVKGREEREGG